MKVSKLLLAITSVIPLMNMTSIAQASDATIRLSDDSVHGQVNLSNNASNLDFGAGYMYHEGSRHIINIDLHAKGQTAIGNLPTTVGIGAQLTGYDTDDIEGGAIGLGGFARLNVPEVPGLSFEGALHYAPSILSFTDSEDMTRLRVQANYRLIQTADVFAGYHYLNTDLDGGSDFTLDEGLFIGMKLMF